MNELEIAKKCALEAGKVLLSFYGKVKNIREKTHADFVTEADYAAEETCIKIIKSAFPADLFLTEELHPKTSSLENTWVIDGLDGTNNFVSKVPIYGVNVACYRAAACVAAAVYIPIFEELYFAGKDIEGAYRNDERIFVSKEARLSYAGGALTTASLRIQNIHDRILPTIAKSGRIRCTGAACYDGALVASGVFDYRISIPEKAVDVAAPYYIVQKAGGVVTDADGSDFDLFSGEWIASNGLLHKEIIELLNK